MKISDTYCEQHFPGCWASQQSTYHTPNACSHTAAMQHCRPNDWSGNIWVLPKGDTWGLVPFDLQSLRNISWKWKLPWSKTPRPSSVCRISFSLTIVSMMLRWFVRRGPLPKLTPVYQSVDGIHFLLVSPFNVIGAPMILICDNISVLSHATLFVKWQQGSLREEIT